METKDLKNKIKMLLSEHLGVEVSDINDDDDFVADLQMEPTSLFDFQQKLTDSGIDVSDIDFKDVQNINQLIDVLEGASPENTNVSSEEL